MDGREQEWIEPLVSTFSRPAFQLAAALVKDHAVAEEIVQEAFMRALASQSALRCVSWEALPPLAAIRKRSAGDFSVLSA